jgi:FHA domain/von Willebrand factor type A domain
MRKRSGRRHFATALSALAGFIGLLILTAALPAAAAPQITIGNPGLQHFDSDGVVQLDFGMTESGGQPLGNLRAENVQVFEDGKLAKILDFRGVGQGRPVDIVFVLDVTESMQPYIDAVKQNIIQFAQDLAANNRDYRLGLVTFEDYVISQYPDCNCEYRNTMTSDVQKFTGWVGTLHAGGGGDIPEDQLDALAYAASFPFRPEAQGIVILVTDAPSHKAGDGPDREGDAAYQQHHPDPNADVTEQTGDKVAAIMQKNGITLYAVAPPPFIAPEYAEIVEGTHGKLYNIVSEESRFSELVREIGHSIATQYSLTYRTPRPIEDGTERKIDLKVSFNGESGAADTSYQVRGVGGAAINIPEEGGSESGVGLTQVSFNWWNAVVPLIAILGLFGLSQMRFGVSQEELKSIVEAQSKAVPVSAGNIVSSARDFVARQAQRPAPPTQARPALAPANVRPAPPPRSGAVTEARLTTVNPMDPLPAEYALLKDEVSLGRGEDNDVVIPHASISRAHARLMRRNGTYELMDLNSTNGSYVNEQPVHGSTVVASGSEVRLGDIKFILRF